MNFVEYLDWDSKFFKKKIGKIVLNDNVEFDRLDYDLIYVFSDDGNLKYNLVDKKTYFIIDDLKETSCNEDIIDFFSEDSNSLEEIRLLAIQSGIHSRFRVDKKFDNKDYQKLYQTWIDKSISKELAIEVLVKKINSKIVGFTTINKKTNELADIGLVAVDENFRGRGIGKELIKKTISYAKSLGFSRLQVVTQLDNISATSLYKNTGFKINKIEYIYHIWKDDTI